MSRKEQIVKAIAEIAHHASSCECNMDHIYIEDDTIDKVDALFVSELEELEKKVKDTEDAYCMDCLNDCKKDDVLSAIAQIKEGK